MFARHFRDKHSLILHTIVPLTHLELFSLIISSSKAVHQITAIEIYVYLCLVFSLVSLENEDLTIGI